MLQLMAEATPPSGQKRKYLLRTATEPGTAGTTAGSAKKRPIGAPRNGSAPNWPKQAQKGTFGTHEPTPKKRPKNERRT